MVRQGSFRLIYIVLIMNGRANKRDCKKCNFYIYFKERGQRGVRKRRGGGKGGYEKMWRGYKENGAMEKEGRVV